MIESGIERCPRKFLPGTEEPVRFRIFLVQMKNRSVLFYMYVMQWKGFLQILQSDYFVTAQAKAKSLLDAINKEYHVNDFFIQVS